MKKSIELSDEDNKMSIGKPIYRKWDSLTCLKIQLMYNYEVGWHEQAEKIS